MRRLNCIFIHIPKAAGTSVLQTLGYDGSRDHSTFREFLNASPSRFDMYFKFTVVREPVARFESAYRYLKAGGNQVSDRAFVEWAGDALKTLERFTAFVETHRLVTKMPLLWPQHLYIADERDQIRVDYVARLETLDVDFANVARRLGLLGAGLGKVNASTSRDVIMSDAARTAIRDLYAVDYELLNYE